MFKGTIVASAFSVHRSAVRSIKCSKSAWAVQRIGGPCLALGHAIPYNRLPKNQVCLVHLVDLVDLVCFVYLVHLDYTVSLVQPNKQDKPNKPIKRDRPDRPNRPDEQDWLRTFSASRQGPA
jgi:hypothetical protein